MADDKKEKEICYQWRQGENYALCDKLQTEKVIGTDTFLVFESGRLINKNMIGEYLIEIPSMDEPILVPEQPVPVAQPQVQQRPQRAVQKPRNGKKRNYDIPHESEIANLMNNGSYSMGQAEVIPHPDDVNTPVIVEENTFMAGLNDEFDEHAQNFIGNVQEETYAPQQRRINPVDAIIDKAKKKEFELELKLKVKLPAQGLFDMLDEDFVKENLDDLLNSLINKIKQNDLDEQIKMNLLNIYNIKNE